jgi:hypothetical protein
MNSIDRKLARCAREIEAAKPKVMSFEDFETLHHAFPDGTFKIKGAAQSSEPARAVTPRTPVAAPPSPKFAKGDRVRKTLVGREHGTFFQLGQLGVVMRVDIEGDVWVLPDGADPKSVGTCNSRESLELIPSQPKADADWIEWGGGKCPVPAGARADVKYRCGSEELGIGARDSITWRHEVQPDMGDLAEYDIVAYRLVK